MVLRILSPHSTLTLPPLLSHPHRAASGGGAPCVTAGDTRAERGGTRGKVDSTNLRLRRRRTESVEKVSSISPPRKKLFFVVTLSQRYSTVWQTDAYRRDNKVTIKFYRHTVVTHLIHTFSVSYTQSVTTWRRDNKNKTQGGRDDIRLFRIVL